MTSLPSRHFSISMLPVSQMVTSPPPYSGSGMVPSNVPYSSGWSSVCTASRFTSVSSGGPLGTAQDTSTPECWRRKSQCRREAWCSWITNIGALASSASCASWAASAPEHAGGTGSGVFSGSRLER